MQSENIYHEGESLDEALSHQRYLIIELQTESAKNARKIKYLEAEIKKMNDTLIKFATVVTKWMKGEIKELSILNLKNGNVEINAKEG